MKRTFLINALFILLFCLILDGLLQYQLIRVHRNDQELDVSQRLSTIRARIEKETTANLLIVQGMADFISVIPDLSPELFDELAGKALEETRLLKNITAAPDFVMKYVYPVQGNEAILGLNYRTLPGQWEQALQAKETENMVVAGPLELVQGGMGLIGRAPVFLSRDGEKQFWGIVSSVIDAEKLFSNVGLPSPDLDIAIRGKDGKGAEGDVFYGDAALFEPEMKSVVMPVDFPAGSWLIAARPLGGWSSAPHLALLVHAFVALFLVMSVVGAYRIAKRNHTIQTVKESLNQAQSIARLGNWELNHASKSIWWSDETYRIFGVDRESFVPTLQGFLDMVHPDDQEIVQKQFNTSVDACSMYTVDHRIIRPNGEVRHVQERGRTACLDNSTTPTHSTGTVLDITDRKLAEEALIASEKRMRAMSEASYDALIVVDAHGIISFWSPAAEKMLGWTRDEALGQGVHRLIAPGVYHGKAFEGLKEFTVTGKGSVVGKIVELSAIRKDGREFPMELSVSSFKLGDAFYAVGSLRDITERKRIEHELRDYADRLALASLAGGIGVWEWNIRTGALNWDDQMFSLYNVKQGEFSGLYEAWCVRVHPEDLESAEKTLREAAQSADQWNWEFRIIWPGGEVRHVKAAALAQLDENGEPEHMIGVNWDVTEARLNEERLRTMATTDALTGLFNRRHFMELAERELERSRRYQHPFSLIMFDADKFKAVNDTYGHDVGDMVLKAIASVSRNTLRGVDILGRIGGEEFTAGLPETGLEEAMHTAERLRAALEQAAVELDDGRQVQFTVSLGVAELDESCENIENLLKHADLALYRAKENGRNQSVRYSPEMG